MIAIPFTAAAPSADAACDDVGGVITVCNAGMGGIGLDIPGLIHLCIKINNLCG